MWPLHRAALRLAAARGRSMVFVYHRVRPEGGRPEDVVPTTSSTLLRAQLDALASYGEIVPLQALVQEPRARGRVRFAITFDDDEPSHAEHALPVLREAHVPATFFLSGRALHGLPPYWWMLLESLVAAHDVEFAAGALGVSANTPHEIVEHIEGNPRVDRLYELVPHASQLLLSAAGMRAIADAGLSVGFHTLHHPLLVSLADEALEHAIREGRDVLSQAVGVSVNLFAYPHGKADRRTARHVQAAGFAGAFTGDRRPVGGHSDRFRLGRLDPGAMSADELIAHVSLRLNYPVTA
jgi:peptidoglycan/xylan/chitin deacetylase (PgdA/CDA1 family)